LEEFPDDHRSQALTIYNCGNAAMWCFGAIAGGWWIAHFSPSIATYHQVFIVSSLSRVACLVLLWKVLRSEGLFARYQRFF
jgi:MFS family permease